MQPDTDRCLSYSWEIAAARAGQPTQACLRAIGVGYVGSAAVFWVSCETDIYTNVIQPSSVNGTPTGNYTIAIVGTYIGSTAGNGITTGTQTTVTRLTSVNLVVQ